MPSARLRYETESFEALMRRFSRAVEKSGMVQEVRRRESYEKPSVTRKRARDVAIRRQRVRSDHEKMLGTKEGRERAKILAKKKEKQEEKLRKIREERNNR